VIDTLEIPVRTASLGSVFTIVSHPPSTTHRQLDDAELVATGITPGLLRCSVGLEDLDDLIADFSRALAAARAATHPTGEASTPRPPRPTPAEPTPV
jgi:cystathionine beta-lyase